ncbi:hypothetical protein ABS315_18735 [Peribacillus frigoritolerans]
MLVFGLEGTRLLRESDLGRPGRSLVPRRHPHGHRKRSAWYGKQIQE